MIRVVIIDDHPVARYGLAQMLEGAGDIEVIASAGSPDEEPWPRMPDGRLGDDPDVRPHVVITDLYLAGDEPSLAAIRRLSADTRVLVMSASGRPADVTGAIQAGARGYVTKHAALEMVVAAVRSVAAGAFWLSAELADILQTQLASGGVASGDGPVDEDRPVLAPREQETLGYIARGFTHAQTASRMGVSKATVDTYVDRIRTKLQVGNKAELTQAAMRHLRPQLVGASR